MSRSCPADGLPMPVTLCMIGLYTRLGSEEAEKLLREIDREILLVRKLHGRAKQQREMRRRFKRVKR